MKKAIFIQHWSTLGGSGVSLYYTCKELNKKFDVTVYLPSEPKDLSNYLESKGIKTKLANFDIGQLSYYSGGPSLFSLTFLKNSVNAVVNLKKLKAMLRNDKPDIVFVNSMVLSYLSIILKEYKSVCFVRETIPQRQNYILARVSRFFLEKFSIVSFLSNFDLVQASLKRTVSVVAHDFLDPNEYNVADTSIVNKQLNIAFLGGNDYLKGLHIILKAAVELKDHPVQFHVIGYMNTRMNFLSKLKSIVNKNISINTNYENYIKKNRIDNIVKIYGKKSDISPIMNLCDIVAFPMTMPHQARPAFEAGIFHKSVIISDFGNIKEFFTDNVNALLFKPNDVKSFISKIEICLENPKLVKQLGEINYDFTIKRHLAEAALKNLTLELEKIIKI